MRERRRVYAYLTSPKGVLILEHPNHPDAGLQIPGGTVEVDETPEEAVVREVFEETTLQDLGEPRLLGRHKFDMRDYNMEEQQDAWFYQVQVNGVTQDSWLHAEYFGSNGPLAEPIPFRFYWSALPYKGRPLIAHHGKYIKELALEMYK